MDFGFDIKPIFKSSITKVGDNLIPEGFKEDRRTTLDCINKIQQILDEMGSASAIAQDLTKSITSGERIKNTNHIVYFLVDHNGSKNGLVTGFLKVGKKNLYVFDETGANHCRQPLCILDFYVHESMQRRGCGRILYDHMMKDQHVEPHDLAIDRPSVKLLGFLYKHYGLERIIPQSNNFVIFDKFFQDDKDVQALSNHLSDSMSVSRQSSGRKSSSSAVNISLTEHYNGAQASTGRFAAPRPQTTIDKILQSPPAQSLQQNGGTAYAKSPAPSPKQPSPKQPSPKELSPYKETPKDEIEQKQVAPSVKYTEPEIIMKQNLDDNEEEQALRASTPLSSCHSDHDDSQGHLDLKFYHSPLW